jgi:enoyl-CoA hydratase/carnithine racemase
MSGDLATLERWGHVAIITLNRPEKLNALNDALGAQLHDLLDDVDAAWPELRVVVLTGAGRAFCAGGDAGQIAARTVEGGARNAPFGREIIDLAPHLRRIPQPIVAAVNGLAIGAGLALACACDLRLAAKSAQFTAPFIRYGLGPDTGLSQSLQRIIGAGRANEMIFTGRSYDAAWAERTGLVTAAYEDDELVARAVELATEIAQGVPRALRAAKWSSDALAPDLAQAAAAERRSNRRFGDE